MPINVLMPALSPTMEKGNLAKWLKKEGDPIKSGDVLAEIETDKATMEVEAVDEGVLAKIVVPEGTADVPVNELIAIIAGEGEDPASGSAGGARRRPSNGAAKPEPRPSRRPPRRTPARRRAYGVRAGERGAGGRAAGRRSHTAASGSGRVFASPLARRIAKQEGVELGAVRAPARMAASSPATSRPPRSPAPPRRRRPRPPPRRRRRQRPPRRPPPRRRTGRPHDRQVKGFFSQGCLRGSAARRHAQDHRQAPHRGDAGRAALLPDGGLRTRRADEAARALNGSAGKDKDGKPAFKLSVNDFVIKAMGLALTRVPAANAVWAEDRILRFKHAEVGVAVAIDGGLFTPVIRQAEREDAVDHLQRDEGLRRPRPRQEAEARGVSGRRHLGVQPRHVRHQALHRGDQPAAIDHPGGGRGREARRREGRGAGRGPGDDRARSRATTGCSTARSVPNWSRPSRG